MKNVLIIIFSVISINGISQNESIFGTNQTSWNTCTLTTSGGFTDSAFVDGDTVINALAYKKVKVYETYTLTFYYEFYLREDTVTGKVWYWDDNIVDSTEKLIIDMSLSLGDTFSLYNNFSGGNFQSIIVDSVYSLSNRKHIRCDYTDNWTGIKLEMIEGVGRNTGMSRRALIEEMYNNTYLLCAQKDSSYTYQHQLSSFFGFTGCIYNWVGINENKLGEVKIYPNPAQNKITVNLNNKGEFEYSIINISGRIVQGGNNGNNQISIESLSNGYYILQIKQGNKSYGTPLIISR